MNKLISLLILTIGLGSILLSCTNFENNYVSDKVNIIFDSDMGPDYDDVGALAMLHALADYGECEILATVVSNQYPANAATTEAINRFFNRPDVPIGIAGADAPNLVGSNHHYTDSVMHRFLPEPRTSDDYASSLEIYRKVLSSQPDKSVIIVTIGFLSNMKELLESGPDEYSPLSGVELVKKKVKKLVSMAGRLPQGREFNIYSHTEAAYYTFSHWPTKVLLSPWDIGNMILTGIPVSKTDTINNPVAWAYAYNFRTRNQTSRQSWDQTAVLVAIRDPEKYFYICGPGKLIVEEDGSNYWDPETDAGHYFLVHKYPYKVVEEILDELMMHEPK